MNKKILSCMGSSIDTEDTYRWFQSQHPEVNQVVKDIAKILELTIGKEYNSKLVEYFEKSLKLERTPQTH